MSSNTATRRHTHTLRNGVVLSLTSSFALVLGCSGDEGLATGTGIGGSTDISGQGGSVSVGGATAAAGAIGVGGGLGVGGSVASSSANLGGAASGVGGQVAVGGSTSTGGAVTTGGTTAKGGSTSTGGAVTTGGTTAKGGTTSTGGTTAKGGTTSTGGTTAKGGTTSTGGTTAKGGTTSTGGTTTSTTAVPSCTAPPAASPLVGWAAQSGTTTGGGTTTPVTVTTLAALQAAAKGTNAAVIYVKGVLSAGSITVGSNKTIAGICGAEIHGHLGLSGSANVIIRNIKIVGYGVGDCSKDPSYDSGVGCSSGDDAITVQNSSNHIWFDHCDISDGTDGNLDITKGSDYVTVSWTKFHYTARTDNNGSDSTGAAGHRYSNLIGGDDSEASSGKLNITWHHNWWADNVVERMPRIRFGKNHLYNNLWNSSTSNYCVRAGYDAHVLIQNSVFSGVKSPHQFNSTADQATAYITAGTPSNTYTGTSGTTVTGGGGTPFTTPPYTVTMDAVGSVQAAVTNASTGAGPH